MPLPNPDREPSPADSAYSQTIHPTMNEPASRVMQSGTPVNIVLIAGSVLVTLYTSWGQDVGHLMPFVISLSSTSSPDRLSEVFGGQVWRLFTPMFLHYSVQHLGFNMLGMVNLGGPLEKVTGSRTYLLLCLGLALLSNLGEYFVNGEPNFGGMSGVLYGLFGYIWLRGRFDRSFVLQMPTQTIVIALVWFVACFTGVLGHIANAAHGIGLAAGAICGVVAGRASTRRWQARSTIVTGGLDDPPRRR